MSQVTFKATYKGNPVEVRAGWDRPLRHFYLTLFDLREDTPEETVWSTLDYPSQEDSTSTSRLREQLRSMEIGQPEEFWPRVELKEGNVVHRFHEDHGWHRQQM